MGYSRDSSGSAILGPMSNSDYAKYSTGMKNHLKINFKTFTDSSGNYYVANEVASYGDFKALVVHFCGWEQQNNSNFWGYTSAKRATCINSAYYPYKLTFDPTGGELETTSMFLDFQETFDFTSNIPKRYKYHFAGWGTTPDATEPTYPTGTAVPVSIFPTGNPSDLTTGDSVNPATIIGSGESVLYAVWAQDVFNLTLNNMNDQVDSLYHVQYGYELPEVLEAPHRTGYIFNGYYTGPNGAGIPYYDENLNSLIEWYNISGPTTLYAKWTPITYSIRFTSTTGLGTMPDVSTVQYDQTVKLPVCAFTRTGYTFSHWVYLDNNIINNSEHIKNLTTVDGAIVTLRAAWVPNTYTVTYDTHSSDTQQVVTVYTAQYDGTYTFRPISGARKFGHRFIAWRDTAGNTYKANEKITWKFSSNIIVTPVFEVSDGILVKEPALIPAGQTVYSIMQYDPVESIELRNNKNNIITAYTYTHTNNVLTVTLNSSRATPVGIFVNGSNILWHKGIMYAYSRKADNSLAWSRTDMYINNEGEFKLIK